MQIVPPDDSDYYWIGEPHVRGAGCRPGANITVVCSIFPWKYSRYEVVHSIPAASVAARYTWHNSGTRPVVPEITVTQGNVTISSNGTVLSLSAGIYTLSELKIPGKGAIHVEISGGPLIARYREAIL